MIPVTDHRCQYGVLPITCGQPAPTKRQRPSGGGTWDVCDYHAAILDRIRQSVQEHSALLARLRDE